MEVKRYTAARRVDVCLQFGRRTFINIDGESFYTQENYPII